MNILIVDDDAMILHLLQIYVGDHLGYQTFGVRSATEAISAVRKQRFDLAIIDFKLPDHDGFQVLREIRRTSEPLALPVLFMTGTTEVEAELEAFALGANDFMRKPFDPRVAVARVRNLLSVRDAFSASASSAPALLPLSSNQDDFEISVSLAPPLPNSDTATLLGTAALAGPMVSCEIPVMLIFAKNSLFCKTIKIGTNSMMVLVFNALPQQDSFRLQFMHPNGEQIAIEVRERERRPIGHAALGAVRLFLEVVQADELYFELCSQLAHALRFHGVAGVREILAGGPQVLTQIPVSVKPVDDAKKVRKPVFRYRFERILGSGGFASVFLVRDLTLKRNVAMKVLASDLANRPEARERFLGEAQIAAQFHHPNIVFLYEVGEYRREEVPYFLDLPTDLMATLPEYFIFFTMHYIQGHTLDDLLEQNGALPVERCLTIFSEALRALAFAHGKGVVHRDLKPANIMVDQQGQVIVTDFGIAAHHDVVSDKTSNLAFEGTPRYASPEQLLNKPVDARSDLYSLATTTYQLLAGEPPFPENDPQRLMARQLRDAPASLLPKVAHLNPEFDAILLRCLAKNPENRFESATAVLEALASIKVGAEPGSSPEDTLTRLLAQVLLLEKEGDVVVLMEKLVVFLHLHRSRKGQAGDLGERIAEPAVLDALLGRALHEEHFDSLYQFFKSLGSSRAVFTLLRWFEREPWPALKAFLARLAVVSSGEDTQPLAEFCGELTDPQAVLMLRAFADENVLRRSGLIQRWAKHRGLQTRLELLRILRGIATWNEEELVAVRSLHLSGAPSVKQEAGRLLETRAANLHRSE